MPRTVSLIAAITCTVLVIGASQPPDDAPPETSQSPGGRASEQDEENQNAGQTTATPQPSAVTGPVLVEPDSADRVGELDDGQSSSDSFFDVALILLTGALVVFTGGLVIVGYLQRKTTQASNKLTEATNEIADTANRMNHAIYRAYVDLSHRPPGLELSQSSSNANVQMTVMNHGETPADLSGVLLRLVATNDPLPDTPPYGSASVQPVSIFLNAGESVNFPWSMQVPSDVIQQIEAGGIGAWLVGYVEYDDRFGRKHRNGYARRYEPAQPQNNLVFELHENYNNDTEVEES